MHNPKNQRPQSTKLDTRLLSTKQPEQKIYLQVDHLKTAYAANGVLLLQFKHRIEIIDQHTQTRLFKLEFQHLISQAALFEQFVFVGTEDGILYQLDLTAFTLGQPRTEALDIMYTAKSGHLIYVTLAQSKNFSPNTQTNRTMQIQSINVQQGVFYVIYQENSKFYLLSIKNKSSQFVRLPPVSATLCTDQYLLIGHINGFISAYDPEQNTLVTIFEQYQNIVKAISFYDENTIFIGFIDGCVAFYNVQTRTTEKTFIASEYQGESGDSIFDQTQIMFSQKGCQDMVFLDYSRLLVLFKSYFFIFDISTWQTLDIINYSFYGNKTINKVILNEQKLLGVGPNILQSITFPDDMDLQFTKIEKKLDKIYINFPRLNIIRTDPLNMLSTQVLQTSFNFDQSQLIRSIVDEKSTFFLPEFADYEDEQSDIYFQDESNLIIEQLDMEGKIRQQIVNQPILQVDDLLQKSSFIPEVSFQNMKNMASASQKLSIYDDLQGFLSKQQGYTQFVLSKTENIQNGQQISKDLFDEKQLQKEISFSNTKYEPIQQAIQFNDEIEEFTPLQRQQTSNQRQLLLQQSKANLVNESKGNYSQVKTDISKNNYNSIYKSSRPEIPIRLQNAYALKQEENNIFDPSLTVTTFQLPKSILNATSNQQKSRFLYDNTSLQQLALDLSSPLTTTKVNVSDLAAKILDLRNMSLESPLQIQRLIQNLSKFSQSQLNAILMGNTSLNPEEAQQYISTLMLKLDSKAEQKDLQKLLQSVDFNKIQKQSQKFSQQIIESQLTHKDQKLSHVSENKNIYKFLSEKQKKMLESGFGNSTLRQVLKQMEEQGMAFDLDQIGEEQAVKLFQSFVDKTISKIQQSEANINNCTDEKEKQQILNQLLTDVSQDQEIKTFTQKLQLSQISVEIKDTREDKPSQLKGSVKIQKEASKSKQKKNVAKNQSIGQRETDNSKHKSRNKHKNNNQLQSVSSESYSYESYTDSIDNSIIKTQGIILSSPTTSKDQQFSDLTFNNILTIFQSLRFDITSESLFDAENLQIVYNQVIHQPKLMKENNTIQGNKIALTKEVLIQVNDQSFQINSLDAVQLLMIFNDKASFLKYSTNFIKNIGEIQKQATQKLYKFIKTIRKFFIQHLVQQNTQNVVQNDKNNPLRENKDDKKLLSGFKGQKSPILMDNTGAMIFDNTVNQKQLSALDQLAANSRRKKKQTAQPKIPQALDLLLNDSQPASIIVEEEITEYYSTESLISEHTMEISSDSVDQKFNLTEREKLFLKYIPFRDPFITTPEIKKSKMNIKYPPCLHLLRSKSLCNLQTRTDFNYIHENILCEQNGPKIQLNKDIQYFPTCEISMKPKQKTLKQFENFENFVNLLLNNNIAVCSNINSQNLESFLQGKITANQTYGKKQYQNQIFYYDNFVSENKNNFRSHSAKKAINHNFSEEIPQIPQKQNAQQMKIQKINERIRETQKEIQKINIFLAIKLIKRQILDDTCIVNRKTKLFRVYKLEKQFEMGQQLDIFCCNVKQLLQQADSIKYERQFISISDDELVMEKFYKNGSNVVDKSLNYLATNLTYISYSEYRHLNGSEDYATYQQFFKSEQDKIINSKQLNQVEVSSNNFPGGIQLVDLDLQIDQLANAFVNNASEFYINESLNFQSNIKSFTAESTMQQMLDLDYKEYYKNIRQPVVVLQPDLSWPALKLKFLTHKIDVVKANKLKAKKQELYILKQEKLAQKQQQENSGAGLKMTFSKMYQQKKDPKQITARKNPFQIPQNYLQISLICFSQKLITSVFQNTFHTSILALAENISDTNSRYLQLVENQQQKIIIPISAINSLQFTKMQTQLHNFKMMLKKHIQDALKDQYQQNLFLECQALRDTQFEVIEDYLSLSLYDKAIEHIKVHKIDQWMTWSDQNETKEERDRLARIRQQELDEIEKLKNQQLEDEKLKQIQAQAELFKLNQFESMIKQVNDKSDNYKEIAVKILFIINDQNKDFSKQYFDDKINQIIPKYQNFHPNMLLIELSIEVLRKQLQIDTSLHFYTLTFAKNYLEKSLEFKENGFSFKFLGKLALSGDSNIGLADFAQGVLNSKEFVKKQLISTLSLIRNGKQTDNANAAYFNVKLQMQSSPIRQELKKKKERFLKTQRQKSFILEAPLQLGVIGPSEKLVRSLRKNDIASLKTMATSHAQKLAESRFDALAEDSSSEERPQILNKQSFEINFDDYHVEGQAVKQQLQSSARSNTMDLNDIFSQISNSTSSVQEKKPHQYVTIKPQSKYERSVVTILKKSQAPRPESKTESKRVILQPATRRPVSQAEKMYNQAKFSNDVDLNITGKLINK